MDFSDNIIMLTDSYKVTHHKQYPPKTQNVYSYFESRGGEFKDTVFFGLQYLLKEYLAGIRVTPGVILEAQDELSEHVGHFNADGWYYILDKYNGKLPVSIKALPEGTVVPISNVLMTVENTDPKCYWLTNYIESLLVQSWYPCTVATQSREMKKILLDYLNTTGTPEDIDFKLHDFGFRGVTCPEQAAIGGAAHLVNFKGTDTLPALKITKKIYNAKTMPGFSIPASEHSTMTSWGIENEKDAYENMLDQYPEGLVAVVSDSYNIYNACRNLWGHELKAKVLNRKGTLVVRPDSGDPPTTVLHVLDVLTEKFGYITNSKGYKVLPSQIRVIQGDGIDINMVSNVLDRLYMSGYSADNIAFGSGGGLLQKVNRDISKYAFKCSSVVIDGKEKDVWKDPIGDKGKKSKRGRLSLVRNNQDELVTVKTSDVLTHQKDELVEVFRDGEILKEYDFEEIRERVKV